MENTIFNRIEEQTQNQLPRIETPIQEIKDAFGRCKQWLEGSEPVMQQLRRIQHSGLEKELLLLASALGRWSLVQELLKSGADPNCVLESSKLTPLHLAALVGHASTSQALLRNPSIKVNSTDAAGNTPLMCACQSGYHAIVIHLLNHSADPHAKNHDGYTAFDFALAHGHIEVIEQLKARYDALAELRLTEHEIFYKICCSEACKKSWIKILQMLAEQGVSLTSELESVSDLVLTSCAYMQVDVLKFLCARDVPVDTPDKEGVRPLFHACYNGCFDMVKLLCEFGSDINKQDERGRSPAYMAAAGGHHDILLYLEHLGCDLLVVTKVGETLLEAAIDGGCFELFEHLWNHERTQRTSGPNSLAHRAAQRLRTEILAAILTREPDGKDLMEKEDRDGNTPLLMACQPRSESVLRLLKTLRANFSHANHKGDTPALILSSLGEKQLLQIVQEAGGSLEHPNWKGDTAILQASLCNSVTVAKFLSDHNCRMNSANYQGKTPAYFAAGFPSPELLNFLAEKNSPLDEEASDGMTPLLIAAKEDRLECVKLLLKSHCRVEHVNSEGQNIISFCAINGNVDMLILAIEHKADVHVRENSGNTAAINACFKGKLEALKVLQKHDCHMDAKNYDLQGGLHIAAKNGFFDVAELLLENDVNCDSRDKLGNTALMLAAEAGHDDIVQLLCKFKCDIHLHNNDGRDALHFACVGNKFRCIQHLLMMGSNTMQTDAAGATPLMLACESGNPGEPESLEVFEKLYSADELNSFHFRDNKMQSCVHYAAKRGNYTNLRRLKEYGLPMDEPNNDKETPLIIAAKGRLRKSVEFLLKECKASVNMTDCFGQSAVHKAASKGALAVVQLLKEHSASLDLPDENGMTPLMLAADRGNDSVVQFLQENFCFDRRLTPTLSENILHLAAKRGHSAIVARHSGRQDLVGALTRDCESCLSLLLKSPRDCPDVAVTLCSVLDLNNRNSEGDTMLLIAAKFGHQSTLAILLSLPECNKDILDKSNNNALMASAKEGHHVCVRILIDAGQNLLCKNTIGQTALHLCCSGGHRLCADLLLDNFRIREDQESPIDWQDDGGNTGLMLAVKSGCLGLVLTLLRHGARWDIENNEGHSAWTLAFESYRLDILTLLEEHSQTAVSLDFLQNARRTTRNQNFILDALQRALRAKKSAFVEKFLYAIPGHRIPCSDGSYLLHACSESNLIPLAIKLVEMGADVNCLDKQNRTPFHLAVTKNLSGMAEMLYKKDATVYSTDSDGYDALMVATKNRNHILVEWLLKRGLKVGQQDKDGYTALHIAAEQGSRCIFLLLLSECSQEAAFLENKNGVTVAHIAAQQGNSRILVEIGNSIHRELLQIAPKKPSILGIACYRGWNDLLKIMMALVCPLPSKTLSRCMALACAGGHLNVLIYLNEVQTEAPLRGVFQAAGRYGRLCVVAYLLKNYSDEHSNYIQDMLTAAVSQGHLHVVRYMLDQKVSADKMDDRKNMPCHVAALRGHPNLLPHLLTGKLAAAPVNGRGQTILHLACIGGHETIVKLFISQPEGAETIEAIDNAGNSALLYACNQGNVPIASLLLQRNADPNAPGGNKSTCVHLACQSGRLDLLEILASSTADLDAPDADNSTGLMMAAARGYADVVSYLLDHGCNPNAINLQGATAIRLAVCGKHMKVLKTFSLRNLLSPEGFENESSISPDEVGRSIWNNDLSFSSDLDSQYNVIGQCDEIMLDADCHEEAEDGHGLDDSASERGILNKENFFDSNEAHEISSQIEKTRFRSSVSMAGSSAPAVSLLENFNISMSTARNNSQFVEQGGQSAYSSNGIEELTDPRRIKCQWNDESGKNSWLVEAIETQYGWFSRKRISWSVSQDNITQELFCLMELIKKLYKLNWRSQISTNVSHLLWPVGFEISRQQDKVELSIVHRYAKWHLPELLAQHYKYGRHNELQDEKSELHKFIVRGVLRGLQELHDKLNFVHGCLTCSSVYIADNQVMLKGFQGLHDLLADRMQPKSNPMLRDAHYKAPELFQYGLSQRNPTPKSDIWSLGILVYKIVTGETPMADKSDHDVMKYYTGTGVKLPLLDRLKNPQLQAVLEGCFRIDPRQRLTAAELLEKLQPDDIQQRRRRVSYGEAHDSS